MARVWFVWTAALASTLLAPAFAQLFGIDEMEPYKQTRKEQQAEAKSMCMSTSVAGYGNLYPVRMCLLKRMMVLLKNTHCTMR
jgi:hypothetical protein